MSKEKGIIRSLRVKILDNEHNARDHFYVVGSPHYLGKDNDHKAIKRVISNIVETEDQYGIRYSIFVENNNEVQLWKDEPKNMYTTLEYDVD